jgi:DNA-binding NarL/FixJ family response regulator
MLSETETICVCGEASNGYEALDGAKQLKPAVIVMDIGMPAMDGLEATRRLRRLGYETEILIFTEHNSEHAKNASLEAGARGYLAKSQAVELPQAIWAVAHHTTYPNSSILDSLSATSAGVD